MTTEERIELAQWAIKQVLTNGANESAVSISNRRNIEIQYRDKKIERLKESVQNSLSLEIYADQRYSAHSTNDLRRLFLQNFFREAVSSTKYLNPDPFRALPEAKYYPQKADRDLKIYDPSFHIIQPADRLKLARQIEAAAMSQSDKIISATAGYSDVHYENVQIHSNGFVGISTGTMYAASAEVTVQDKNGGRPEDWCSASVRFHCDLPPADMIGKTAADRALRKIGQCKVESGKYDMIVENRSGSRLLSLFQTPMTARALQQKSSFLDGMLNKKIASPLLTVIDDPFLEKGLASRLFDSEGLAAEKKNMIENGILRHYYIDNYYGKKLGMEPNAGSPSNIRLRTGEKSREEMIGNLSRGILITGFIGGNSNTTTGDFSYGIVGLLIENGEIVKPVNEMNISGNAGDFWNRLVEIGNDPYTYAAAQTPSMLFEGVQFSGI
ncbi:MAG TPA: TldD/PmbA family protein [Bacteroidetes bacterium]|nr:TldD/PmbA family protein [Bacteroidota bacterium]